ncbi:MAG TPA: hypothetical protein VF880_12445 [Actinomycetes bacterium]|jgi:hypothetical protein
MAAAAERPLVADDLDGLDRLAVLLPEVDVLQQEEPALQPLIDDPAVAVPAK